MDKREFWSTKSVNPEYFTVTFYHSAFGYYRLVDAKFSDVTLGGNLFKACTMKINPPDIGKDPVSSFSVSFPRIVVGREFKQAMNKISLTGSFEPIKATYTHWIGATLSDVAFSIDLYVSDKGGIAFNGDSVTVKATDDNPMRLDVSTIFTIEDFSGLEMT